MPYVSQSSRSTNRSSRSHTAKQLTPHQSHKTARPHATEIDEPAHHYSAPADPSEPPNYDYNRDRGRRMRLRKDDVCVFNHQQADSNPLLDVRQWRDKLRQLRTLPKPPDRQQQHHTDAAAKDVKRPRHKPHKHHRSAKSSKRTSTRQSEQHCSPDIENGPLKISANIPGADMENLEDSDLVAFDGILDPKTSADARYEKYLQELGRDGSTADDLESLYSANHYNNNQLATVAENDDDVSESVVNVDESRDDNVDMADEFAAKQVAKPASKVNSKKQANDVNMTPTTKTDKQAAREHNIKLLASGRNSQTMTSYTYAGGNQAATSKRSSSTDQYDVNMAEMIARAPAANARVLQRSQSTDPVMSVTGTQGALHDKHANLESRLSLNNFKLRLNLSDDADSRQLEVLRVASRNNGSDLWRKHQSIVESARAVTQDVKLVNYVTKPPFSPRRLTHNTNIHRDVLYDQENLRREALHIPASTKRRQHKLALPATKTAITVPQQQQTTATAKTAAAESKGGGWHGAQSNKRDIDYKRLIPVSVVGDVTDGSTTTSSLWKFQT